MIKPIEHFSLWTVVIFQIVCIALAMSGELDPKSQPDQVVVRIEKPEAIVEIDWDQAEYEYIPAEEAEYVRD